MLVSGGLGSVCGSCKGTAATARIFLKRNRKTTIILQSTLAVSRRSLPSFRQSQRTRKAGNSLQSKRAICHNKQE